MSETIDSKKSLKELPWVRAFGMVDEKGKPQIEKGFVFACRGRIIVVDLQEEKLDDYGTFIAALSTMALEERCIDIWHEYFDKKEEASS